MFFIPLISLLRNAARNSLEYKRELAMAKAQQVDPTNFEKNITDFKTAFSRNYLHIDSTYGTGTTVSFKIPKQEED